jgi:hypothetical protein
VALLDSIRKRKVYRRGVIHARDRRATARRKNAGSEKSPSTIRRAVDTPGRLASIGVCVQQKGGCGRALLHCALMLL